MLYNPAYDDTYLVTRFLGGLRDDIRAPIALHRPKDVATASSLALLQEEEVDSRIKLPNSRADSKDSGKSGSKVFSTMDKPRSQFKKDDTKKPDKAVVDDKWAALLAHRKANGLCYTCGEKWTGRGHKCPEQVSIHMLQELMDLFQVAPHCDSDSDDEPSSEEIVLAVQDPTSVPLRKRRTMCFQGMAGKQDILILLDSGSVGTFITPDLAASLPTLVQPCDQMQYSTTDGSPMVSATWLPDFKWSIQGHSFAYPARVLPLKSFDMILGSDWLEDHSPTWIHWKKRKMWFPLNGRRVLLRGLQDDFTSCKAISSGKLKGLL